MTFDNISRSVDAYRDDMTRFLIDFCSIPAVNPSFGGKGEYQRAVWLKSFLERQGLPVEVIEVPDEAVPEGKRINLLTRIAGSGKEKGTLWIMGHMDTVAPGQPEDWDTDPLVPTVKEGRIYGRGVEDNGQAVVCMVYAAITMNKLGLKPKRDLGLIFVSDEESGSVKGLKYLVNQGMFKPGDEALVPDSGSHDGSFVEVAEKSQLWCKFTVIGKEIHAAWPHLGINASWIGSLFAVELIQFMRQKYLDRDVLFDPPYSTFELTQKFNNVGSPNIVPGRDVFVVDFRVLPKWRLEEVIADIDQLVTKYEYRYKVNITYEFPQRVDAPEPTSPDASIVKKLVKALEENGISPTVGGIGGGTCAAILRKIGIPAVVWSTLDELAHEPNEYTIIDNIVADTKTFLKVIMA